jgi:hypothetical protein
VPREVIFARIGVVNEVSVKNKAYIFTERMGAVQKNKPDTGDPLHT